MSRIIMLMLAGAALSACAAPRGTYYPAYYGNAYGTPLSDRLDEIMEKLDDIQREVDWQWYDRQLNQPGDYSDE